LNRAAMPWRATAPGLALATVSQEFPIMSDTVSVLFTVEAEASPCLLPRLLQPFAKRDLTPDHMVSQHHRGRMRVELGMEHMPAEMVHLVAGNLGQVVGVHSITEHRETALRAAA
jgi:hypothetical protein